MPAKILGSVFEGYSSLKSEFLTAAKWRPDILGFGGYGSEREARVLARVLMTRTSAGRTWLNQKRGWRQFLDTQVPGYPALVQVGSAVKLIKTDLAGYIDLHVQDHNLSPGWQTARIHLINKHDWERYQEQLLAGLDPEHLSMYTLSRRAQALGMRIDRGLLLPIRIVGEGETAGIVSDIDDTILVSMVPHKLLALRYVFIDKVSTRQAVPGMAYFLSKLQRQLKDLEPVLPRRSDLKPPFIFLSNGAWNTMPVMRQFLARSGFPRSTTLLRPWWISAHGLPISGPANKLTNLEDLRRMLPQVKWFLVGDNGQHDPEIYSEFGRRWPQNVAGVAIRTLLPREHLSAHGTLTELSRLDADDLPEGVPLIAGEDGFQLTTAASTRDFNDALRKRIAGG